MLAPFFEGGEQSAHGALAHLVGACRTHQQRHQVALLNAQRLLVGAFGVIDRGLVQLALASHLIQLMQFQPDAVCDRAVQLEGAQQRTAQAANGALQGKGHQGAVVARFDAALLRHHDLVAIGQVVLQ